MSTQPPLAEQLLPLALSAHSVQWTLQLLGYTLDAFGAYEQRCVTDAVAQLLDCSAAAVSVSDVRSARRRLLQLGTAVLVTVEVDARAAGVALDALAAALLRISYDELLAALRRAGLAQLLSIEFGAGSLGVLPARLPPPLYETPSAWQAHAEPASARTLPAALFDAHTRWSWYFLVAALLSFVAGALLGHRSRHAVRWCDLARVLKKAAARASRWLPRASGADDSKSRLLLLHNRAPLLPRAVLLARQAAAPNDAVGPTDLAPA